MKTLRITGVPEHFNYPFRLLSQQQPFLDQGIQIEWKEESRGSGQMNLDLRNGDTDMALLLTESFLKDAEAGNPSKMIGYHVISPLVWGIHVGSNTSIQSLSDLKEKKILVSRMGSGSHLMALVLAKRENWNPADLSFDLVGNMEGAEKAMAEGSKGIFLWEKYTTAPMVKKGRMRRIGEIPSPWPCFVMVASDKAIADFGQVIFDLRDYLYSLSKKMVTQKNLSELIGKEYDLPPAEIEKWLSQTEWCTEPEVSKSQLIDSMKKMMELGILNSGLDLQQFIALDRVALKD
ncbi:ABC transporter substrate-binding protein [Algoriphagus sp. AK58]|uniref:ABC transporter substrate-binding protein n=1 Tax=Algoriphagus sp. AK58 TaxID=1406877 RepID=UPI00164F9A83|nr:ABC transporter substrate-binding protein [Algoriphagus sp. AK58]MBC6365250.1 ABC transporter substrate-binding protein [Algoriphagus sp. AK58]